MALPQSACCSVTTSPAVKSAAARPWPLQTPPHGPGQTGPRAPARRRVEAMSDAVDVSDTELARRIIEEGQERLGVGGQRS
ncbi:MULTISPECIES: hypothetical protein [Streptomyces]|uniref:hypothetical protein n=1 Tax=Streptomyces TaxID=1883 RepID=UPI00163B6492|nr:hypothetical protein [Streptomyces sp. WAC 01325]